MSYNIGLKIKELRIERNIKQEDIASILSTTRQRYARMENGLADISYPSLQKIAASFSVPVSDITSADEEKDLLVLFREKENSSNIEGSVGMIMEILRTFHSHEKLYYQMKEMRGIED